LRLAGSRVFEVDVVQPVGQLDEDDANVVPHGEQHFANVFGPGRASGAHHLEEAPILVNAFDERCANLAPTKRYSCGMGGYSGVL